MPADRTKSSDRKSPRRRISLHAAIGLAVSGLLLMAIGIVFAFGFSAAQRNTDELQARQAQGLLHGLEERLTGVLDLLRFSAIWIAEEVVLGRTSTLDSNAVTLMLRSTLASTPALTGVSVVFPDGHEHAIFRDPEQLPVAQWFSDEPHFIELSETIDRSTWTPPVHEDDLRDSFLALITPLMRSGKLQATLIQGVSLRALSRSILIAETSSNVIPFALFDRTWVLAHPLMSAMIFPATNEMPVPSPEDLGDFVLAELDFEDFEVLESTHALPPVNLTKVTVEGTQYTFLYREISAHLDLPITIGVYFKEAAIGHIQGERLHIALIVAIAMLAVSPAVAYLVSRAIARPVGRLASASGRIEAGDLADFRPLPPTPLREIDDASASFNAMVSKLGERQLYRELLGKLVPEEVADQLVGAKGVVVPQSAEATVLFADIAGFSTLAETLSPDGVVDMLNAYFSVASVLIRARGGVITQFQGDGILAVFNVPIANANHAANAVRAGMDLVEGTQERTFAGHRLKVRVGINTGPVVAGCVGSSGRLSYTVHGDAVNVAARLEQLNKDKGTSILVAEATTVSAGDISFDLVDSLTVRGRSTPLKVYTLSADTDL